jgi:hypothetical protein
MAGARLMVDLVACESCAYFKPMQADAPALMQKLGECHRFPPTLPGPSAWPQVLTNEWCNEYSRVWRNQGGKR